MSTQILLNARVSCTTTTTLHWTLLEVEQDPITLAPHYSLKTTLRDERDTNCRFFYRWKVVCPWSKVTCVFYFKNKTAFKLLCETTYLPLVSQGEPDKPNDSHTSKQINLNMNHAALLIKKVWLAWVEFSLADVWAHSNSKTRESETQREKERDRQREGRQRGETETERQRERGVRERDGRERRKKKRKHDKH